MFETGAFILPKPGELVILVAPMTAGKTVLIDKLLRGTGVRPEQIVDKTQASHLLQKKAGSGAIYHFNSLLALADTLRGIPSVKRSPKELIANFDFRSVVYWNDVLHWAGPKRAVILVIDELTWWRRIAQRTDIVPGSGLGDYPSDFWLQVAQVTDLAAHYRGVMRSLRESGIAFIALDATTMGHKVIEDIERQLQAVALLPNALTDEEICLFTGHSGFEQGLTGDARVLRAKQRNRRSNAMKILFQEAASMAFPDLKGKSVLDVQCGWGGFCFEAERRGASRVVGIEQSFDRFAAACGMKRILGSSVQFLLDDPKTERLDVHFDIIGRSVDAGDFSRPRTCVRFVSRNLGSVGCGALPVENGRDTAFISSGPCRKWRGGKVSVDLIGGFRRARCAATRVRFLAPRR